ncbi:DnaJ family domain-containing protein [Pontibacillus marinus]|uniref:Molecular chaperone DnaJ n=1 Tax=Pontibacillus marinus BH030004 = DSM 16465 TaxID=1385511 RepID=A0A0A5GGI8_9BACI|nr:DUF1992 domain-containing protein [Pontibacillus marinus]KGX90338.1 molecular chaperone DnaJ [Pontibacillus marinus BH030004 = DSM 16465]
MDFAFRMAEERIKQADRNGEFKDLPGKGKPLDLSEINAVPEDLRMGYTIMKNANMIPEEMQIKKDIVKLEDLLQFCEDPEEKASLRKEINEKQLRFQTLMDKRKMKQSGAFRQYRGKINRKIGL